MAKRSVHDRTSLVEKRSTPSDDDETFRAALESINRRIREKSTKIPSLVECKVSVPTRGHPSTSSEQAIVIDTAATKTTATDFRPPRRINP